MPAARVLYGIERWTLSAATCIAHDDRRWHGHTASGPDTLGTCAAPDCTVVRRADADADADADAVVGEADDGGRGSR
jgi:hypothetical protein